MNKRKALIIGVPLSSRPGYGISFDRSFFSSRRRSTKSCPPLNLKKRIASRPLYSRGSRERRYRDRLLSFRWQPPAAADGLQDLERPRCASLPGKGVGCERCRHRHPGRFLALGKLKGTEGDQNYEIPADIDLGTYRSVTIWCARFSVSFETAPLAETRTTGIGAATPSL